MVDVLEVKGDAAERYSCLSCVCNGTTFHLVWMVSVGGGQPKSTKCLRKFLQGWVAWAGWPAILTCDRGLHNRGAFSRALTDNGVYVRMAALEAPEHIGRGEVHGKIYKKTLRHRRKPDWRTTFAHRLLRERPMDQIQGRDETRGSGGHSGKSAQAMRDASEKR